MTVSASYLTYVLEQLDGVTHVVTKRMFGGVGVYSGDVFFAVIDNDTLFFKVDQVLAARYVMAGMPPFQPIPGKAPMMSYYQVPPGVLEDADQLVEWAKASVSAASAGRAGTRAKRRGART